MVSMQNPNDGSAVEISKPFVQQVELDIGGQFRITGWKNVEQNVN